MGACPADQKHSARTKRGFKTHLHRFRDHVNPKIKVDRNTVTANLNQSLADGGDDFGSLLRDKFVRQLGRLLARLLQHIHVLCAVRVDLEVVADRANVVTLGLAFARLES